MLPLEKKEYQEILDRLNQLIADGSELSEFEFERLSRKSRSLPPLEQYVALTALHAQVNNCEETIEFAKKTINFRDDEMCRNVLCALSNINQHSVIVSLFKENDWLFGCYSCVPVVYESASFLCDFEIIDSIESKLGYKNEDFAFHESVKSFLEQCSDCTGTRKYIEECMTSSQSLLPVNKDHRFRCSIISDEGLDILAIELAYNEVDIDIEAILDFEFEWHSRMSKLIVNAEIASRIAFGFTTYTEEVSYD